MTFENAQRKQKTLQIHLWCRARRLTRLSLVGCDVAHRCIDPKPADFLPQTLEVGVDSVVEDFQKAYDVEKVEVGYLFEKVEVRGFLVGSLLDAAIVKLGTRSVEVRPAGHWKNVMSGHQVESPVAAKNFCLDVCLLELLRYSAAA